jgi:xanthosine utilization system XapX-like protein
MELAALVGLVGILVGLEAINHIRKRPRLRRAPVVAQRNVAARHTAAQHRAAQHKATQRQRRS